MTTFTNTYLALTNHMLSMAELQELPEHLRPNEKDRELVEEAIRNEGPMIEGIVRGLIQKKSIKTDQEAVQYLLDAVYGGEFEGVTPQVHRKIVRQVLDSFKKEHWDEWRTLCQYLGLLVVDGCLVCGDTRERDGWECMGCGTI